MYTRDMNNTPRFTWERHPAYINVNILIDNKRNKRHCMMETSTEDMVEYTTILNRRWWQRR